MANNSEKKNDSWKLGLVAGVAAISAGLGYYYGTQSHDNKQQPHSYAQHTDNTSSCKADCAVCLNKIKPVQTLSCGHSFHDKCISPWLSKNPTCPLCRRQQ